MSLLDKASLIVTPNAVKESKLYSVVPSSGAGDMDVVRATTATRVNSSGLIEVVPRNLLTYSEQFDNAAWTKNAATISANSIAAPNGFTTADKLVEDTTNDAHYLDIRPTVNNSINISSIYVKAAGRTKFQLREGSNGDLATFDLSSPSGNIQSVGNDWYRVWLSTTPAATTYIFQLRLLDNSGNLIYTGNGTSGLYVWGAQLEIGSTATEYFPTTTRLNIPRIDYTNGSCPSLLVEPQRTNIVNYSEQFETASWTTFASNATVTANNVISPDGTQNADRVVFGLNGYIYQEKAITGWASATLSIYTKTTTQKIVFGGATPAGTDTYSTINVGNGWYRQILKRTFTISGTGLLQILPIGSNETLYFWGCQVEQGSYATSYVPTVASSVTRNADVISKTGISSLIGQTEGTMFLDIKAQLNTADEQDFSISDGTTNNRVIIRITSTGVIRGIGVFAGNVEFNIGGTSYTSGNRYKIALAYKNNFLSCSFSIN